MIEKSIAGVALIISISAVWIAYTQGEATREHNRLSMRPALEFKTVLNRGNAPVGLSFTNEGVGPAIIENLSVYVDGVEKASLYDVMQIMINGNNNKWMEFSPVSRHIEKKSFIAPDKHFPLLTFKIPEAAKTKSNFQTASILSMFSRKLCVRISYCSVYGEPFLAQSIDKLCQPLKAQTKKIDCSFVSGKQP